MGFLVHSKSSLGYQRSWITRYRHHETVKILAITRTWETLTWEFTKVDLMCTECAGRCPL